MAIFTFIMTILLSVINLSVGNDVISRSSSPLVFNIFSGVNLGGYGDIASNLYMKDKMRVAYPKALLNYIIHPSVYEKLKILIPEVSKLDFEDSVIIDGTLYMIDNGKELPRADILFGFSAPPFSRNLTKSAAVSFSFAEYSDLSPSHIISEDLTSFSYWLSTGTKNLGIYTSKSSLRPTLTDKDFINDFNKQVVIADSKKLKLTSGTDLGFAYCNNLKSVQLYIDLYSNIIERSYQNNRTVIIVKKISGLNLTKLPKNLEVIQVGNIPLKLTEELFNRVNLPSLVTGDMSLTLSIDNKVVPLYEQMYHKKNWELSSIL